MAKHSLLCSKHHFAVKQSALWRLVSIVHSDMIVGSTSSWQFIIDSDRISTVMLEVGHCPVKQVLRLVKNHLPARHQRCCVDCVC